MLGALPSLGMTSVSQATTSSIMPAASPTSPSGSLRTTSRRPLRPLRVPSDPNLPPAATLAHSELLKHFQDTLSRLVSCSGDSQSFDAFTALADRSCALYLSILAWAGRHLANSGHPRYEAICERLGAQAGTMVLAQLEQAEKELHEEEMHGRDRTTPRSPEQAEEDREVDGERMTLLAAALMVMQFRVSSEHWIWLTEDLPRGRMGL